MIDYVKVQPHHLFLIRPQFRPFLHFLDPYSFFGGLGLLQKFFGTYLYRQSILVFNLATILVFDLATFGASLALFWVLWDYLFDALELFLGPGSLFILEGQSYFLFYIRPKWGPFCTFWSLWGFFFEVAVRIKTYFGTYLFKHSTLVLKVQAYFLVFNLATFLQFFASYGDFFFLFFALRVHFYIKAVK